VLWIILLICFLSTGTLFFSVNAAAFRTFSRAKLLEAFRNQNKRSHEDKLVDIIAANSEKLAQVCSLYRLGLNICILLLLLVVFTQNRKAPSVGIYFLTFIAAAGVFIVFSLAIPHAWAKYAGEKVLIRTYRLLTFFAGVVSPFLYVWKLIDTVVRRLAGVAQSGPDQLQDEKEEEFLTDLEQQRIEGVVDKEEQRMIERVLELADTTAEQIMTPRTDIVAVEVNTDLPGVLKTINEAGHSRIGVYEDNIDNRVGFVYAKDLLTEIGKTSENFKLRDKLRDAYFVPESKTLRVLLHEFQNQKLHIAVVLDEYGGTAGIVTLEDILEELVGEIADEYEQPEPEPIKQIGKDTVDIDARTNIDDINEHLELNLPEDEDYDTIGGFVFSHLGYIPKTGDSFEYKNLEFTITSAERRRIKRIKIRKKKTVDM